VASVTKGGDKVDLKYKDDYIAFSGVGTPEARVDNAEIVFVGYGIVAPEYQWDDYKGVDLKGKVLLMMNNDPAGDPKLFAGKTRQYYGRWTYKYEIAAQKGAAGAIIIHTEPSAGYKWQVVTSSWSGENFSLPSEGQPEVQIQAWATERPRGGSRGWGAGPRRLARGRGEARLQARAARRLAEPHPAQRRAEEADRERDRQAARPRSDPGQAGRPLHRAPRPPRHARSHEAGRRRDLQRRADNASGVAAVLAIARAMKALPQPPRRTILFAAVAGEEQGLLGSGYLAAHPPAPIGLLAANINIDELGIWGKTRDMIMIGKGKSTLDTVVEAIAAAQGRRHIVGDQNPDKGFFYRSDQFNLAKRGVPAAYLESGVEVVGKPEGWGAAQHAKYEETDYHQPSDELRPDWDFSGAVEDTPAPLLSRGEGRRRQEHAELEPRRRVRGRAEEGPGRDAVAAAPQGADSVTIAISGGTRKRTGSRLVPMPEAHEERTPALDDQPVGVALAIARGDDGPAQERHRDLPAVGVSGQGEGRRARARPGTRRGCAVRGRRARPRARARERAGCSRAGSRGRPRPGHPEATRAVTDRRRFVLQHADAGALEVAAHAGSIQPPIVVPEHGHDAVGRAQPGQVCGRRLRRDEPAEQHVVDDEVAQDDDEVRMRAVRSRDDLVEPVEAVAERADVQVGEDGDAQRRPRGGPASERTRVSRTTSRPGPTTMAQPSRPAPASDAAAAAASAKARAPLHPTTNVGTLPPPALTLMTELREARVTAPPPPRGRRTGSRSP
jgi:hypothetical protein